MARSTIPAGIVFTWGPIFRYLHPGATRFTDQVKGGRDLCPLLPAKFHLDWIRCVGLQSPLPSKGNIIAANGQVPALHDSYKI